MSERGLLLLAANLVALICLVAAIAWSYSSPGIGTWIDDYATAQVRRPTETWAAIYGSFPSGVSTLRAASTAQAATTTTQAARATATASASRAISSAHATLSAQQVGYPLLQLGFADNAGGFRLGEEDNDFDYSKTILSGDSLKIEIQPKRTGYHDWMPKISSNLTNFAASLSAERTNDAAQAYYGLAFRKEKAGNMYAVLLGEGNSFRIDKVVQLQATTLIGWRHSVAIQAKGSNKITVSGVGSRFAVFINDTCVAQFDDGGFPRGLAGPVVFHGYAGQKATFAFSKFEFRIPTP